MNNLIADIDIISGEEAQACDFKTTVDENTGKTKKLYIESYGCAMNFADSEVVASIMKEGDLIPHLIFTKPTLFS